MLQHAIAELVAVGVVGLLEEIQVAQRQHMAVAMTVARLPRAQALGDDLAGEGAVDHFRQRIVIGFELQVDQLGLAIVDIDELADRAQVNRIGRPRPQRAGQHMEPTQLVAHGGFHLHIDHRIINGGGTKKTAELLQVLLAERRAEGLVVVGIHDNFGQIELVIAPVGQHDHRRLFGELELHLVAHGSEEVVLHALVVEQLEGAARGLGVAVIQRRLGQMQRVNRNLAARDAVVQALLQITRHRRQAFQNKRVERAALPFANHAQGLFVAERRLVNAATRKGVVHIGQGNYLGRYGNVVTHEAIGVPPAVPALMVSAADVPRDLH